MFCKKCKCQKFLLIMSYKEAIIFLIDNSDTSINGDFEPNRLDAQKLAVQRLANFHLRYSPQTDIAIGSIGSEFFGIHMSLMNTETKINQAFEKIQPGGKALVCKGILCAILALKYAKSDVAQKRIVLFVGSRNDLTPQDAKTIVTRANVDNILIDIVAFGTEVDNLHILENITRSTLNESYYIRIRNNKHILSDSVLSSPLGPVLTEYSQDQINEDDELAFAIKASMEDAENMDLYANNDDII